MRALLGVGLCLAVVATASPALACKESKGDGDCVVQVAAGEAFTCAVTDSGAVWCWGRGSLGQLGNGATSDSSAPVRVALRQAVQVTAGKQHACAIKRDGTLWCWGDDTLGQLGNGVQGLGQMSALPIQVVALGSSVVQVSADTNNTCALTGDGTDWCWGDNQTGADGQGFLTLTSPTGIPTPSAVVGLTDVVDISTGGFHACAVKADGTLWCWGENGIGELGIGTIGGRFPSPLQVGLTGVSAVSAGFDSSCALLGDGSVWCWGNQDAGELGNGQDSLWSPTPVNTGLAKIRQIAVGFEHACAVGEKGALYCWGSLQTRAIYNGLSQVATGSTTPVKVGKPLRKHVSDVAVGEAHTCAIKRGRLYCLGANQFGELGLGDTVDRSAPARVPVQCR